MSASCVNVLSVGLYLDRDRSVCDERMKKKQKKQKKQQQKKKKGRKVWILRPSLAAFLPASRWSQSQPCETSAVSAVVPSASLTYLCASSATCFPLQTEPGLRVCL